MGFFFEEIFHFAKTTEFSWKGGWRTARIVSFYRVHFLSRGWGKKEIWYQLNPKSFSELFLIHSFLCSILFPIFNMGIGDFLHVRTSMFRGRADVPGFIRRNEYKKKIFLTRLVADLSGVT